AGRPGRRRRQADRPGQADRHREPGRRRRGRGVAVAFADLTEVLDGYLDLPVRGIVYRVHQPDAETGLRIRRAMLIAERMARGEEVSEADREWADRQDLERMALGDDLLARMRADGVRPDETAFLGMTVLIWIYQGRVAAEAWWASGGDPERLAPNREARRSGQAAASTTRSRGSTSGTNRRRGTSGGRRGRGNRSRGRGSSITGR